MAFVLSKTFRFEAAHFLPEVPREHPCRRMHGHSYRVEVSIRGEADDRTGWVLDYGEISGAVRPALQPLDHNLLNSIPGLENPTSEKLAAWVWERVAPVLPALHRITVMETCQSRCEYPGPGREADKGTAGEPG